METRIDKSKTQALFLEPDDIREFSKLLSQEYSELSMRYEAVCSEDSKFVAESVDELLAYENPNFRKFVKISIGAGSPFSTGCHVEFRANKFFSCNITLRDEDDKRALHVITTLENRLKECRPWYWPLAYFKPLNLLFIFAVILALAWFFVSAWTQVFRGHVPLADLSIISSALSFSLGTLPIVMVIVLVDSLFIERGWGWLFPKVVFNIGKQQKISHYKSQGRSVIFGTIGLGVILGLLVNFLYDRMK